LEEENKGINWNPNNAPKKNEEEREEAINHLLADYHLHPGYSVDAIPATLRQYCLRALELDLKEICFTPHLEHEWGRPNINNHVRLRGKTVPSYELHWLDEYFREIENAREEFKGNKLIIKAGVEIGYNPQLEELISKVLQEFPFDFVLGAVHSINGVSISSLQECPEYFSLCTLEDLRRDYFHVLTKAVESGFFDCLAHLDIYRRYGYDYYGPEITTMHRGAVEPVLTEAARRNIGLEINTSSIRRGSSEFHPSLEILRLAVDAGVNIFTVGSDAHAPEELGANLEEAFTLLKEMELSAYGFNQRKPYLLPGSTSGSYISG